MRYHRVLCLVFHSFSFYLFKKRSFKFTPFVNSMVICFTVFFIGYIGHVYGVVWRFEARTCQTATKFIRCNALEISTIRQMHYTRCYAFALYWYYKNFQISSINKLSKVLIWSLRIYSVCIFGLISQ
jgi:hypothetical protein